MNFINFLILSSVGIHDVPVNNTHSSEFNLGDIIIHHLGDVVLWNLNCFGFDISITKRVVMMWIASLFLLSIFIPMAQIIARNPYKRPSRFFSVFEILVEYIRKEVSQNMLGKYSKKYDPFLLTLFFFILFCNLLGLLPPFGEISQLFAESLGIVQHAPHDSVPLLVKLWPSITATGDISVTGALSAITFITILSSGFLYQGVFYIKNIVPSGVPLLLYPMLWAIELIGLLIKPFALAVRLLANMTAGHVILIILLGFIFQFKTLLIAPVSIGASTAIYFLEIFVAFLQAYIFTFLTTLFIAEAQHRH